MGGRKVALLQGTLNLIVLRLLRARPAGRRQLAAERQEWARFTGALALILGTD